MRAGSDIISQIVVIAVLISWLAFAAILFFRKRPPRSPHRQRDLTSVSGILLAGVGFMLVWSVRRPIPSPFIDGGLAVEMALACVTIALSISSVLLVLAAVRTLGKQWSLAARLVEDHKLVTEGPYGIVRHPIYTGMMGMMLVTGLAFSVWYAVIPALLLGWTGTMIRIRSEERLLRAKFGETFLRYAERVPTLIPYQLRS